VRELICKAPVRTVLQIAGFLALVTILFLVRRQLLAVLKPFIIALALAYILNPVVLWLQQRRFQRTVAVLIIYLIFFGLLFAMVAHFAPVVSREVNHLAERIPWYTQQAQKFLRSFYNATDSLRLPESVQQAIENSLADIEKSMVDYLSRIPQMTTDVARAIFNLALVLILTFYLLKDFEMVKDSLYLVLPRKSRTRARKIFHEIDHSLGKYIRGQLLISLIIALTTYLSLLLLGVDFALILGLLAGATNIIPYFGPFIGAVPAVVVALLKSPALALKTAIVFFIIQQAEGHFIAPQVLGKSLGLHPVVVILTLLVGGQFFGIIGMMVAVPVVAVARILIRNLVVPPVDGR
jgi:sporulation integral membrane protein YtvI